jgi:HK97 gp10 family phage protein
MNFELEGMRALVDKLNTAGAKMGGPEMKKALRAGGRVIKEAMVERAPMMLEEKTAGSDSLEPGALKDGMRVAVIDGENGQEAIIGPNSKVAYVARFVEYGHRQVSGGYLKLLGNGKSRGTGTAGTDIPAYPFLRPAFEASVSEVQTAMEESLRKSFSEVLS